LAFVAGSGSVAAAEVLTTARFAHQVLTGRWFTLLACLLILSASSATYAFGIYSRALKSSLGYDQRAVATLAFFKDLGSNVGVPAGLLSEVAPPWAVLAVDAAMNLAGYLMVYLSPCWPGPCSAAALAHVRLRLRGRQLAGVRRHRRDGHVRPELPRRPWRRARPAQGLRRP
jgi:hypothetical protein